MIEFYVYKKSSNNSFAERDNMFFGAHIDNDTIAALMAPAPKKSDITNVSRTEHGTRVIHLPYMAERSVTLKLVIVGKSKADHLRKYKNLLGFITGEFAMKIPAMGNDVYFLSYQSSQSYNRSVSGYVSTLALKVTEYDPSRRAFPDGVTIYRPLEDDTRPIS